MRAHFDELLPEVLDGSLDPGRVVDMEVPLDDVAEACRALDERRALEVIVRP